MTCLLAVRFPLTKTGALENTSASKTVLNLCWIVPVCLTLIQNNEHCAPGGGEDDEEADDVDAHSEPAVGSQVQVAGGRAAVLRHVEGVQEPLLHAERTQRLYPLHAAHNVGSNRTLSCSKKQH